MRFAKFVETLRLVAIFGVIGGVFGGEMDSGLTEDKQRVLESSNLIKCDFSKASRERFQEYLERYCLGHMKEVDILRNYIRWERVEFLQSVREFLNPVNSTFLAQVEYHELESNCTFRNSSEISANHDDVDEETAFENKLVDMTFAGVPGVAL